MIDFYGESPHFKTQGGREQFHHVIPNSRFQELWITQFELNWKQTQMMKSTEKDGRDRIQKHQNPTFLNQSQINPPNNIIIFSFLSSGIQSLNFQLKFTFYPTLKKKKKENQVE